MNKWIDGWRHLFLIFSSRLNWKVLFQLYFKALVAGPLKKIFLCGFPKRCCFVVIQKICHRVKSVDIDWEQRTSLEVQVLFFFLQSVLSFYLCREPSVGKPDRGVFREGFKEMPLHIRIVKRDGKGYKDRKWEKQEEIGKNGGNWGKKEENWEKGRKLGKKEIIREKRRKLGKQGEIGKKGENLEKKEILWKMEEFGEERKKLGKNWGIWAKRRKLGKKVYYPPSPGP